MEQPCHSRPTRGLAPSEARRRPTTGTPRERSSPCCHCRPRFLVPTPLRCRSDKKRRSPKLRGLGLRRDLSQRTNSVSRSGRVDPRFWTLNTSVTPPASHETRTVSPVPTSSKVPRYPSSIVDSMTSAGLAGFGARLVWESETIDYSPIN